MSRDGPQGSNPYTGEPANPRTIATTKEPSARPGNNLVLPMVMRDLRDRAKMGRSKHGQYLRTHNGRNALVDAYQEVLDAAMYLRQAIADLTEEES